MYSLPNTQILTCFATFSSVRNDLEVIYAVRYAGPGWFNFYFWKLKYLFLPYFSRYYFFLLLWLKPGGFKSFREQHPLPLHGAIV